MVEQAVARIISRRLGGYRQRIVDRDPALPVRVPRRVRVAVIGGGLAGITSALTLAARGAEVVLFEREPRLGGKLAGWREQFVDPDTGASVDLPVDHGFHACFRHYYNFRRLLADHGLDAHLRPIDDYRILRRDGTHLSFSDRGTPPGLNVLGLMRAGLFDAKQLLPPGGRLYKLGRLLRYVPERTFAEDDGRSFAEFASAARLPPALELVFTSFARAFFADPDRMSLAELIKSFHFYYLSHDQGLLYDHWVGGYERAFVEPITRALVAKGVEVRTGVTIERIERGTNGSPFVVAQRGFDEVIVAATASAASALLGASELVRREAPAFAGDVGALRSGQRYAVVRLFARREVGRELPVFCATERAKLLDSITFVHRVDPELGAWARARGDAAVYELHSYAVPDDVGDADIARAMRAEMETLFPAFVGARVVHEHVQIRGDFPAFHVGMHARRPGVTTPIRGLSLAGDWVKLPRAAMLMEAACMSGLLAANAVLERVGCALEPVDAVPDHGIFP